MHVSPEGHLVTVINVFETKPERQQELIDQWIRFVEEVTDEPVLTVNNIIRIASRKNLTLREENASWEILLYRVFPDSLTHGIWVIHS